jgi:hypothetical protein
MDKVIKINKLFRNDFNNSYTYKQKLSKINNQEIEIGLDDSLNKNKKIVRKYSIPMQRSDASNETLIKKLVETENLVEVYSLELEHAKSNTDKAMLKNRQLDLDLKMLEKELKTLEIENAGLNTDYSLSLPETNDYKELLQLHSKEKYLKTLIKNDKALISTLKQQVTQEKNKFPEQQDEKNATETIKNLQDSIKNLESLIKADQKSWDTLIAQSELQVLQKRSEVMKMEKELEAKKKSCRINLIAAKKTKNFRYLQNKTPTNLTNSSFQSIF